MTTTKTTGGVSAVLSTDGLGGVSWHDLQFCGGDDGRAYYVKGHVQIPAFMDVLRQEVGSDDPLLREQPEHCWMRVCRDFEEGHQIIVEAKPNSKGAFRATWIQDA